MEIQRENKPKVSKKDKKDGDTGTKVASQNSDAGGDAAMLEMTLGGLEWGVCGWGGGVSSFRC